MPKEKISCSVAILTHNSADTLPRALESVQEFAEIIICDGHSTDNTLYIACSYGAKIIAQSSEFLEAGGRIKNFAGVRNQTLAAAAYEWFLFIDSDEYITPALREEIAAVVQANTPAVYWVPRKYVLDDVVIEHASTYPNQQMRFFNRSCTTQFVKEVHERIQLKDAVEALWLKQCMLVPLPKTVGEMVGKWRGYLAIEASRQSGLTLRQAFASATHELLVAGLYFFRIVRIRLFSRGAKLPLSYELARLWYQGIVITIIFSRVNRL